MASADESGIAQLTRRMTPAEEMRMAATHSGLMRDLAEKRMALPRSVWPRPTSVWRCRQARKSRPPPDDPTRTPCEGHLRPHIDRLRSRGATKKESTLEHP
jgi:hypothetical protein